MTGWRGINSGFHNSSRKKDKMRENASPEDRKKYMEAWSKMMVDIWREKIDRLKVVDTRALRQQMNDQITSSGEDFAVIQHKFMQYGIYQDCGTGRGYDIDGKVYKDGRVGNNKGDLESLDWRYRDNSRERRYPREWFSRPYFASVMVLKEQMAYMYAEEFCGLIVDAISYNEKIRGTSMRNRLWGSHWKNRNKYSY